MNLKSGAVFLTLALIFSAALPAHARQWVVVFESPVVTVFLDVDSIKGVGNIRNFWIRYRYSEPRTVDFSRISSSLSRSWVNCDTEQVSDSQFVAYDEQGRSLFDSGDKGEPEEWRSVLPDTAGEEILKFVCRRRTAQSDQILQQSQISLPPVVIQRTVMSESNAVSWVMKWLKVKAKIFGPSYDSDVIGELTTGKLYAQLTSPQGPVAWLRNNQAYYRYANQRVEKVKQLNVNENRFTIEAYIRESTSFFKQGRLVERSNDSNISLVRYEFVMIFESWKLADYKVLESYVERGDIMKG